MSANGVSLPNGDHAIKNGKIFNRAAETEDLLNAVQKLIIPFIDAADEDAEVKQTGHGLAVPGGAPRTVLVEHHKPEKLIQLMQLDLPSSGKGRNGLLAMVETVLKYSVNTWDQGFLDKLYGSTNAVGLISELLLATLNTNLHVYQVSPALSVIEKLTARKLANMYGFTGPHAGGISTQGGSGSNVTAMVIARNNLYPDTKTKGNGTHDFVIFTSEHGHYSLEKAASMCGLGSGAVCPVPVDSAGSMIPSALEDLIVRAKAAGKTPFFVNSTAGTTVLGSYDDIPAISAICKKHGLWLHIDGSWGGSAIFSKIHRNKLNGTHLANSLCMNPHKMLAVPCTCSFLLGQDIRQFHKANTLPAGYLFHGDGQQEAGTVRDDAPEVWDLADLTLQCGRRGDSLKLALSWIYYGSDGYERQVDHGFRVAAYFAQRVAERTDFVLVSENPPPCLQVCFYYAPNGKLRTTEENTKLTRAVSNGLLGKGFMIDYAPGEKGSFFRVVVNTQTRKETVDGLIKAIVELGTSH